MEQIPASNTDSLQSDAEKAPSLVTLFRSNDLYDALFPASAPIFEKGEWPTVEKVVAAVLQNPGKEIILDGTCQDALGYYLNAESEQYLIEQGFAEALKMAGFKEDKKLIDLEKFTLVLKEKYSITLLEDIIEVRVEEAMGGEFSPELVKDLFEIAKEKNPHIQKVYILSQNIADHVGKFPKDEVLDVLAEKVQSEFGITPVTIPTMQAVDVQPGDLIIVDRHNPVISSQGLHKVLPHQVSVLPIQTELFNNDQFLDKKVQSASLIERLRKAF